MTAPRDAAREARTHDLKCWPTPFAAIRDGRKGYEIRRDDRGFRLGDFLRLREYGFHSTSVLDDGAYTGGEVTVGPVTYISYANDWVEGVSVGFVVLGFVPVRAALAGASPPEPSEGAITAAVSAGVAHNAGYRYLAPGRDRAEAMLRAAYAADFGVPPSSAPPTGEPT